MPQYNKSCNNFLSVELCRYCGSDIPGETDGFTSLYDKSMVLHFVSNSYTQFGGFHATYVSVNATEEAIQAAFIAAQKLAAAEDIGMII